MRAEPEGSVRFIMHANSVVLLFLTDELYIYLFPCFLDCAIVYKKRIIKQGVEMQMKTMILYFSSHHGNTKKLAEAIAAADETVEICEVSDAAGMDLEAYDRVGIASGIYAGNFGKPIMKFAEENIPKGKEVFFLYTSAMKLNSHTSSVRKLAEQCGWKVLGEYGCRGYNTFGPFKLIGGTSKGHPTKEELDGAVAFYQRL